MEPCRPQTRQRRSEPKRKLHCRSYTVPIGIAVGDLLNRKFRPRDVPANDVNGRLNLSRERRSAREALGNHVPPAAPFALRQLRFVLRPQAGA